MGGKKKSGSKVRWCFSMAAQPRSLMSGQPTFVLRYFDVRHDMDEVIFF